jgi:putative transcriptional regulator
MATTTLAPGLLLAAPPLGDPNFNRSVVILGIHGDGGSLGWVVNGQEIAPVAQLLRDADLVSDSVRLPDDPSYALAARVGGPVSPRSAWVLYRRAKRFEHQGEIVLTEKWAATGDRTLVDAIARGEPPEAFRLLLGYAGWAPGQLDNEVRVGAWMPARIEEAVVFETDAAQMWQRAYESLVGVSPFAFTSMKPGSA